MEPQGNAMTQTTPEISEREKIVKLLLRRMDCYEAEGGSTNDAVVRAFSLVITEVRRGDHAN